MASGKEKLGFAIAGLAGLGTIGVGIYAALKNRKSSMTGAEPDLPLAMPKKHLVRKRNCNCGGG